MTDSRVTWNRGNYKICICVCVCVSVCTKSVIEGHTEKETPQGAWKAFVTSEL